MPQDVEPFSLASDLFESRVADAPFRPEAADLVEQNGHHLLLHRMRPLRVGLCVPDECQFSQLHLLGHVLAPSEGSARTVSKASTHPLRVGLCGAEKEFFIDHLWSESSNRRDDFSRPALRHGSLNSRFPDSLTSTFQVRGALIL